MNTTSCHENDRLTLADAYRIVNGETDGCEACTELAWRLVDADLEDEWAGHRVPTVCAHRWVRRVERADGWTATGWHVSERCAECGAQTVATGLRWAMNGLARSSRAANGTRTVIGRYRDGDRIMAHQFGCTYRPVVARLVRA